MNGNPFRVGLETERTPPPCAFVIFGASGDLTKRKLLPALYNLVLSRLSPPGLAVVGFALTDATEDQFRAAMREAVSEFSRRQPIDEAMWQDFASRLHYLCGRFEDPTSFARLREKLDELDRTAGTGKNRLYYLAIPPSVFGLVIDNLKAAGLVADPADPSRFSRVVVEKPFGRDYASADALNAKLHRVFDESQIFRIDHYLGKETVQNLVALRFGNTIFEPIWNRNHIDHVQITVAEDLGVEGRGKFYEEAGAMRDIVQNHLLQLLMIMAMEPPIAFTADEVRDEKVKVLRALKPIRGDGTSPPPPGRGRDLDDVTKLTVRGQYGPGSVGGRPVPGYRQEPNVSPTSNVETFVAMRLEVDNWRFAGVPIYVRAGKRMARRITEISVHFKRVPHALLSQTGPVDQDVLAVRIQPDEGIALRFVAKVPGQRMTLRPVTMDFRYGSTFGDSGPEAYERLILDAMLGDPTLFARVDEVNAAWRFVTPILEAWADGASAAPAAESKHEAPPPAFPNYPAGTWGPKAADDLIERDGRSWRRL